MRREEIWTYRDVQGTNRTDETKTGAWMKDI